MLRLQLRTYSTEKTNLFRADTRRTGIIKGLEKLAQATKSRTRARFMLRLKLWECWAKLECWGYVLLQRMSSGFVLVVEP